MAFQGLPLWEALGAALITLAAVCLVLVPSLLP